LTATLGDLGDADTDGDLNEEDRLVKQLRKIF